MKFLLIATLFLSSVAAAQLGLPGKPGLPFLEPKTNKVAYAVGADLSGTWFNPAQNGHGFVVQHIVNDGVPAVLVSWFTYQGGKARWLFGIGTAARNEVRVALSITSGADFPPRFLPANAQVQPWGELLLRLDSNSAGRAVWTTTVPGFSNGEMPIVRLTQPSSRFESTDGRIASCHAGAWFDPAQDGHGVLVEVIGPPEARQMLAVWYTYLNGEQRWLTALGPIQGDTATLSANLTRGADFPPNFEASQVVTEPWGTMTFRATGAGTATWSWNSSIAGFGSGSMPLTRLTTLSGSDCGPTSDADAARFLTQATFGPTPAEIATVRELGYEAWVDRQRTLEPTLQRAVVEQRIAEVAVPAPAPSNTFNWIRQERWFDSALYAPDQLRQRVAFALSQILVVSEAALEHQTVGIAEYNDILLRHAFGNYRDLLRDVTLNPTMGEFLTSLRNQKTDWMTTESGEFLPGSVQPDENYAREVMQLFSIGLIERNRDFSPILENGQPIATYAQDLITDTARVLTGLSYPCTGPATVAGVRIARDCGCIGPACQFFSGPFLARPPRHAGNVRGTLVETALTHPDNYSPMVCYPRYADTGRSATALSNYAVLPAPHDRKQLLAGVTVGPSPVACHSRTPESDQPTCIAYCNGQINTLIDTLFVHPNVAPFISRQLIQRLTTSSPSAGYIDRVAAVFEDNGQGVRGDLGAVVKALLLDPEARTARPAPDFGKLREPILKVTAIWRAFGVANGSNGGNFAGSGIDRTLGQSPLRAPSVFNFFEADYQHPGEIAERGLYSPEFKLLNEATFVANSDTLWRRIFMGYTFEGPNTVFATPTGNAHIPPASIDALPANPAELIEVLNIRLLNGRISDTMRSKLLALLNGGLANYDHRRKVLNLIHLIAISPEFAVQI